MKAPVRDTLFYPSCINSFAPLAQQLNFPVYTLQIAADYDWL